MGYYELMPGLGGIGQQVADNLFELGQSTVKSAVKAGTDIVGESIEQITSAPSSIGAQSADSSSNQADRQVEMERKQREARQYQLVKRELETYIQRKQQQDAQIAQERTEQENQRKQKEGFEKKKKANFVQKLLEKTAAGSHGETAKQKE